MSRSLLPLVAAVGHRGFSAGSNLVLTVIAGRIMDVTDFGLLALMMATLALLLIPHSSFFSEPMLVYGPKDYAGGRRRYLSMLGSSQLGLGLLCALGALIWGAFAQDGAAFVVFALAAPLALTMDFQERSFFMQLRPEVPFFTAMAQFLSLCFMLFVVPDLFSDDVSGFLTIHVLGLLVSNLLLGALHGKELGSYGQDKVERADVLRRHARFAVWALVSHLMLFLVTNFYIFLLPMLLDLETTANFRAQSAIIGPGAQAFSALGMMAVPMLRVASDPTDFRLRLQKFLMVISVVGGVITIIMGVWGGAIINLVYSGKYGMHPIGYWLAGFFPLAIGYAFMLGSGLRAIDRADLVAKAAGIAAVCCLPVGVLLILEFKTEGVLLAQIIGSLVMAGCCVVFLLRHFNSLAPRLT